jgi:hypothetical protein
LERLARQVLQERKVTLALKETQERLERQVLQAILVLLVILVPLALLATLVPLDQLEQSATREPKEIQAPKGLLVQQVLSEQQVQLALQALLD